LIDRADDFSEAFSRAELDLSAIFCCAESVLLSAYRGRRIGHGFFDRREAHTQALGFLKVALCGVVRPQDHPLYPETQAPLDPSGAKEAIPRLRVSRLGFLVRTLIRPLKLKRRSSFGCAICDGSAMSLAREHLVEA